MSPPPAAPAPVDTPQWQHTWAPDRTDPNLPPITLITDPHDQAAYTTTALTSHQPARGRIAVHPTPLATAPAYLAHDLIRALGKHPPRLRRQHYAGESRGCTPAPPRPWTTG
ncbi:hypothetical protein [Streptomyces sp. NPDC006334]|uniref:hypothetical protein n=1 Tax=Streptomyces sp. NPDC006334 TaxID=3156754 RepID=UPI0033ACDA89